MNQAIATASSPKQSYLISTAVTGLVVIVPLAILFLAAMEIYGLLDEVAFFAQLELPFPGFVNAGIVVLIGVLAVFTVCLVTGLLLQTGPGKRFANFVEKQIADKVPLLGLVRKLTLSFAGADNKLKPVEADVHGSGVHMFGFLMETLADGRHVIFVPSAPTITVGHTYIIPPERVVVLNTNITNVVNTLTQWGAGAGEIYRAD
jgi:uncharacterized membrane protein